MGRLQEIEGLRAYLALWVVVDHVMAACGYSPSYWGGIVRILAKGWYAVDAFIIISGFVIFYLLDSRRESYIQFIVRRFFRLWPLLAVTLLLSVVAYPLFLSNPAGMGESFPGTQVYFVPVIERITSWRDAALTHVLLHLTMLHGMVPELLLANAPTAYVEPAWSISLEWQFYLVAPGMFMLATSRRKWSTMLACMLVLGAFWLGRHFPEVQNGAFLPMHVEFFCFGGVSYFLYRSVSGTVPKHLLMGGGLAAVLIYLLLGKDMRILPVVLWVIVLLVMLECRSPNSDSVAKALRWFLCNPVVLHLGKISYSIYLSHMLVIVTVQALILELSHGLTQSTHMLVLAVASIPMTVLVSQLLYSWVEMPGMHIGQVVASRLSRAELTSCDLSVGCSSGVIPPKLQVRPNPLEGAPDEHA